jgi:hypothetical protein
VSSAIKIKIYGNNLESVDYEKEMDEESLITQVFSIGKLFKGDRGIGD